MNYRLDVAAQGRLETYFQQTGQLLDNRNQRASFALYAMGILGEAERKSVEPIAARALPDLKQVDAVHQRLLHFLSGASWDDAALRSHAARFGLETMMARGRVRYWIIDDTSFLKQGVHSVGVQRQYAGSVGKVANCQVGVSLCIATAQAHLPVDFELYLPRSWTDDPERRRKAKIPDSIPFKTKPQLALDMLRRAKDNGTAPGTVLADSAFGDSSEFRAGVRELKLPYAVGIHGPTLVRCVDQWGPSPPVSAKALALRMGRKAFRRLSWREGTKGRLESRFAFKRVVVHSQDEDEAQLEQWLIIEWPKDATEPTHYFLCTLNHRATRKYLVRVIKERYRTEQMYAELKGELGLDHYEGRRYPGWHHHVTVVLCCYAFVVAERERSFPPSARRTYQTDPQSLAA